MLLGRVSVSTFSAPAQMTNSHLPPNPNKLECFARAPQSLRIKWGDMRSRGLDTNHHTLEMEKEDGTCVKIEQHIKYW